MDGYWFAVQRTSADAWDNGSHDLEEAKQMLREQGEGLIAVINENTSFCVEEFGIDEIDDIDGYMAGMINWINGGGREA